MGVRIAQREQGEPRAHVAIFLWAQLGGLFGLGIRWGRLRIVSVVLQFRNAPLPAAVATRPGRRGETSPSSCTHFVRARGVKCTS